MSRAEVKRITRYPVKGLSGEILESIALSTGHGLPHDRQFALALPDTPFDPAAPKPFPKTRFAVLMKYAKLAELSTRFDTSDETLSIKHPEISVSAPLNTNEGRERIATSLSAFMQDEIDGQLRVVAAPGHRFTDVSVQSPEMMEAVSLINLASIRDLEDRIQRRVDPRRFRANFLVDGLEPWEEFNWLDRTFSIGGATFKAVKRTRRCVATEVNPDTAERDILVPQELMKNFGHMDLGIYLTVQNGSTVHIDDHLQF
ncbi:MAG TPA: MOSC domain-containing protein [Methylovirgula sp.]|nr:MOSC domain-containing protein [Methylovirgula sp.]